MNAIPAPIALPDEDDGCADGCFYCTGPETD
ncbi:hypothetical protein QFZ33_002754 [Arthrobacter globiformis]|nr:hypothetical protein [Arthrobacter globiformis]